MYCATSSAAVDVGPELQVMIKEQQDKLRKEYETKLAGLVRMAGNIPQFNIHRVDKYHCVWMYVCCTGQRAGND